MTVLTPCRNSSIKYCLGILLARKWFIIETIFSRRNVCSNDVFDSCAGLLKLEEL
ncbi:hypothetical protein MK541_01700 [Streptococcus gallolyticus subsp. gallolyticus]|uniref:hypothetical protein n=1 Tax=Streptococcus gallolyticus TaxID=315405 RepID=UPI0012DA0223|nr:hypothetical protein [Streptococcus gallolyticus]MCY7150887.1 hypothetical protein [Streptococcus gallolyticus subsp. gallolyticus]